MSTYIAGPMSGIDQYNFPAFDAAASFLRERDWDVVSPAELDDEQDRAFALASNGFDSKTDRTWGDFLARDVKIVADECDSIVLLDGWERSRGARLEAYVAIQCGHELFELVDGAVWGISPLVAMSIITMYTLGEAE